MCDIRQGALDGWARVRAFLQGKSAVHGGGRSACPYVPLSLGFFMPHCEVLQIPT